MCRSSRRLLGNRGFLSYSVSSVTILSGTPWCTSMMLRCSRTSGAASSEDLAPRMRFVRRRWSALRSSPEIGWTSGIPLLRLISRRPASSASRKWRSFGRQLTTDLIFARRRLSNVSSVTVPTVPADGVDIFFYLFCRIHKMSVFYFKVLFCFLIITQYILICQ